jgi:hypothetical protein
MGRPPLGETFQNRAAGLTPRPTARPCVPGGPASRVPPGQAVRGPPGKQSIRAAARYPIKPATTLIVSAITANPNRYANSE